MSALFGQHHQHRWRRRVIAAMSDIAPRGGPVVRSWQAGVAQLVARRSRCPKVTRTSSTICLRRRLGAHAASRASAPRFACVCFLARGALLPETAAYPVGRRAEQSTSKSGRAQPTHQPAAAACAAPRRPRACSWAPAARTAREARPHGLEGQEIEAQVPPGLGARQAPLMHAPAHAAATTLRCPSAAWLDS